jgi:hypothetical protein
VKKEMGFHWRALFIETEQFFDRVKKNGHVIVLSSLFFHEVEKITRMTKEDIMEEFGRLEISIELVPDPKELQVNSYVSMNIPRLDAMHVAHAIHNSCDMIVTFNVRDFLPAQKYIPIVEPARLV